MKLNFLSKIFIIVLVLGLTFLYAYYEKSKIYSASTNSTSDLVLKALPEFNVTRISDNEVLSSKTALTGVRGLFVHIWGTWCAPCEKEMPEFLDYARKLENQNIQFLLIAVNDEESKIKKFLVRFPSIPKNVTFVIDKENKVMDLLGILKVPETFLFNSTGKHINKFIGPQDWLQESYITRLNFWLSDQKLDEKMIETH